MVKVCFYHQTYSAMLFDMCPWEGVYRNRNGPCSVEKCIIESTMVLCFQGSEQCIGFSIYMFKALSIPLLRLLMLSFYFLHDFHNSHTGKRHESEAFGELNVIITIHK